VPRRARRARLEEAAVERLRARAAALGVGGNAGALAA